MKVQKRDGSVADFKLSLIESAVRKAGAKEEIIDKVSENCVEKLMNMNIEVISIYDIQKIVEKSLKELDANTFLKYSNYREKRDVARAENSKLVRDVKGVLDSSNREITRENANRNATTIVGKKDLLTGIISKFYASNFLLPKNIKDAHESGDIHFHDLTDSPTFESVNCCLVDMKTMLENGFALGEAEIETPRSIKTAVNICTMIILNVSSSNYGGTSFDGVDTVLAPYVKATYAKHYQTAIDYAIKNPIQYAKDLTKKDTFDAFQSFEYNINSAINQQAQVPFVTFGFGLGTSWEERIIQESILEVRIGGLGKDKVTAVFPKLIFAIKEGLNRSPKDPNYDIKQLALRCSSERMYPDIVNYDKLIEVTGNFKYPMGCRSFLDKWVDPKTQEEVTVGRFNCGVVSLNLPRIGIRSKGDEDKFYKLLDEKLDLCFEALMFRLERYKGVKAKIAPILYQQGAYGHFLDGDDDIFDLIKDGRASISLGYLGIHETMLALYGAEPFDGKTKNGIPVREKAQKLIKYISDRVKLWKKETGFGFSLYGTPSENLCDRFCKLDVKEFGVIPGINDKEYYTNSFHLDVEKKVSPYQKIDFEKGFAEYSSGGFISFVELPSMKKHLEVLEMIWDYTYDKLPYFAVNTPCDRCFDCGYTGEFLSSHEGFACPCCGNNNPYTMSVVRRVSGYISTISKRPFNRGKTEEVIRRIKHHSFE